jgi:hypothetical protein
MSSGPGTLTWAMKWDNVAGGYVWLKAVVIRVWAERIDESMWAVCAMATIEKRRGHRRGVYGTSAFILLGPAEFPRHTAEGMVITRLHQVVAARRGGVPWIRPAPCDE